MGKCSCSPLCCRSRAQAILASIRRRRAEDPNKPKFNRGSPKPVYNDGLWYGGVSAAALKSDEALTVVQVDLEKTTNREAHHTDQYGVFKLVIRRAQEFGLSITFNKDVDLEKDKIRLQFTTGKKPQQSKGTLIRVPIVEDLNPSQWGSLISSTDGRTVNFRVIAAADALVGKYSLNIQTWHPDEKGEICMDNYRYDEDIYILFNPWGEDDVVYLPGEDERNEYVLNDTGRIYVGNKRRVQAKRWNFGQFEDACLEGAIYLLDNSYLDKKAHGNPTQVTRALSAMTNVNDNDKGVLSGNWSGRYDGGRRPTFWNGSVAIMQQYMTTKRDVKWGQCWVFSGLLTTLCRALGIPARSVTNFESAHDTDYSMTVDNHIDTKGQPLNYMNDSIWNFHVWNEGWFKRPDLPDGNDGWQAFDATPQEASEGQMRCGPAPVNAIRDGNVFLGYDTKFLFAEVNGDRITWMVDSDGGMTPVDVQEKSIGISISTKAVGGTERNDITDNYKHPEGSEEERRSVQRASQHSSRRANLEASIYRDATRDVTFNFDSNIASNGDFTLDLKLINGSDEARNVEVHMHATARYYTGLPGEELGHYTNKVALQAREESQVSWNMSANDYINRLDEDATVGMYIMARVAETKQIYTAAETCIIDKPELEIKIEEQKVKLGQPFKVEISFKNPLAVPLTEACFSLEGPGIQSEMKVPVKKVIAPDQEVKETVELKPHKKGYREILANFNSKQLSGIEGHLVVAVEE